MLSALGLASVYQLINQIGNEATIDAIKQCCICSNEAHLRVHASHSPASLYAVGGVQAMQCTVLQGCKQA
jgi:hypothetical protein